MTPIDLIPSEIRARYEVHDFRHAATVLAVDYPTEFGELCDALRRFTFTDAEVIAPGGNESTIPKAFSRMLHPLGWRPESLKSKMMIDDTEVRRDTHIIDYVKGQIAFDVEWNSKDQTFDRDLAAFRTFFEFGRISVAILVTRDSSTMVPYLKGLGTFVDKNGRTRKVLGKYGGKGGSTTHMNQLLPRLEAGRAGGCPVLALGITSKLRVAS